MQFTPSPLVKRHPMNPLVAPEMAPFESSLTFNAGVAKFNGKYVMVFRNDHGITEADYADLKAGRTSQWPVGKIKINLGLATSDDCVRWDISPRPFTPIPLDDENLHAYDPRLTVIDGRCHMCFAVDTPHGIRGAIAATDDFDKFELLSMTTPDNRNMVLFPERIGGMFVRLERPFPVYGNEGRDKFDTWMSKSPDMRFWGESSLLLATEDVPFCNDKIGPGAPPVRTRAGWLTAFHSVWKHQDRELDSWHGGWRKEYFAGLALLDLADPSKVIGMCPEPLLASETDYEIHGYRGSVIFPGGMILEDSGEVKIYYGAADTCECLATAHVDDLIALCLEK